MWVTRITAHGTLRPEGQFTLAQGNALGNKSALTPHTRPVRAGQFCVVVFKLPLQGARGVVPLFTQGVALG